MALRLSSLLFAAALFTLPACAQDNQSWDGLSRSVKAGQRLRVVRMNLASVQGKLVAISEDGITIEEYGQPQRIERTDVFRVSRARQRARHTPWGLAIGTAQRALRSASPRRARRS